MNKEEGNGSNNKIPKVVRKLMKRKAKLSRKAMSISWSKHYEVLREIEDIEAKLDKNKKSNRIKQENIAIKKLMKNPRFFYSYQRKFSKTSEKMSGLLADG